MDGVPLDMADLLEVFQVSLISWHCFIRKTKALESARVWQLGLSGGCR